jgi:arylsulfatase A
MRTFLIIAALSIVCGPSRAAAESRPPNIVLIFADDVGREVLGCYGGESYKTPNIDALAKDGRRFDHCYSMPVCHPSRVCLMTGKYPAVLRNPKWGSFPKDQERATFASLLKKAGYSTAVAGKWQLSLMKDDLQQPARMGFDEWSVFGWHEGPRYHEPMIYQNGELRDDTAGKYGPDLYVDFLVDFIQRNKDRNKERPFFAYYSMALCHDVTDDIGKPVPHGPDGRWLSYEEMARDMDHQVGRLVGALDRMELRDNTLILFTTDNGTAASSYLRYENGKFERPPVFSKMAGQRIQGGKGQLTDWGTRVPLIATWPGHVPAATATDDLVDFSDFLPTLAELAQTPLAKGSTINGHSFAGSLLGNEPTPRKWAYSEGRGKRQYVRTQRYKLYSTGEFFDMDASPDEQRPLDAGELDAKQIEVRKQLQAALDSLPAPK